MSRGADGGAIIGVNWASAACRAWLIAADGAIVDEVTTASGVLALDRAGMAAQMDAMAARWPDAAACYAVGMIGSPLGWVDTGYADAPAGVLELAAGATAATIGATDVTILPGIACLRTYDGAPDVLRGEEVELIGVAQAGAGDGLVVFAGAHGKWVRLKGGRIGQFFTSLSGEIAERLTAQGLLASVASGEARAGAAFRDGVAAGIAGNVGLATSLFGIRPRVVRGELARDDAPSWLRGLLIGAEIADARRIHSLGEQAVTLIGAAPLRALYAAALDTIGIAATTAEGHTACAAGFRAIHEARHG